MIQNMLERDERGLVKGVDYKFTKYSSVDWRAMIPNEFLAPNVKKTQETDVSKLKDEDLIVLLGGYQYLADLRGFNSVMFNPKVASIDYACVQCIIEFMPNFETNNKPKIYSGNADAHFASTSGFGRLYYTAVAENRAFARTVRNFLKIKIVSEEEIAEMPTPQPKDQMFLDAETLLTEKGLDFNFLKDKLIEEKFSGAEDFQKLEDIPQYKLKTLLKKVKKFNKP